MEWTPTVCAKTSWREGRRRKKKRFVLEILTDPCPLLPSFWPFSALDQSHGMLFNVRYNNIFIFVWVILPQREKKKLIDFSPPKREEIEMRVAHAGDWLYNEPFLGSTMVPTCTSSLYSLHIKWWITLWHEKKKKERRKKVIWVIKTSPPRGFTHTHTQKLREVIVSWERSLNFPYIPIIITIFKQGVNWQERKRNTFSII